MSELLKASETSKLLSKPNVYLTFAENLGRLLSCPALVCPSLAARTGDLRNEKKRKGNSLSADTKNLVMPMYWLDSTLTMDVMSLCYFKLGRTEMFVILWFNMCRVGSSLVRILLITMPRRQKTTMQEICSNLWQKTTTTTKDKLLIAGT